MFSLACVSVAVLPILGLPEATGDCRLEILALQTIDKRTITEFEANVEAYVRLHRHFVRALPMTQLSDEEGWSVSDELRAALVVARPLARQGGFFTPRVTDMFRSRIDRALLLNAVAPPPAPLYEPLLGEPGPSVNEQFPRVLRSVEWPALAGVLPVIPAELAYAFWGRDLVLVDVSADLVIDVLPDALPDGVRPGGVYVWTTPAINEGEFQTATNAHITTIWDCPFVAPPTISPPTSTTREALPSGLRPTPL
jgi:hypothetical protein